MDPPDQDGVHDGWVRADCQRQRIRQVAQWFQLPNVERSDVERSSIDRRPVYIERQL
jgi:hypothetical protein